MSKIISTNEKQSQISLEEQASKDNIFFSESLNGIIDEDLSALPAEPSNPAGDVLFIGTNEFSVSPLRVEREEGSVFVDLKIHNFNISDFINFDTAVIDMAQRNMDCRLLSYCCPNEKIEYGLIRILLLEGT